MFYFDSLASVAQGYILCDISLHPIPLEILLKVLIHLSTSWMDRVSRIMCFTEYGFSESLNVWYAQPLLEPYRTLLIFSEMWSFSILDELLDLLDLFILELDSRVES